MNPDRRAEIEPQIQPLTVGLPRELRISPLAARLLLTTVAATVGVTALEIAQRFSGNTSSTVEAAAAMCQTGARIRSVAFFDMAVVFPDAGIRHVYDKGIDIDLGAAYGFEVRAVSVDGKVRYGSNTPVKNAAGTEATGQIVFQVPCNTETVNSQGKRVQGVRFGLVSSQHPENIRVVTIANGERHVENFGREISASRQGEVSDVQRFLTEIDAGIIKPADLEKAKIDALRKWVQSQPPTATGTPTPTATPTPLVASPTATRIPETPTVTASPRATESPRVTRTPDRVTPTSAAIVTGVDRSAERNQNGEGIPGWLWGISGALFAFLGYKLYERWNTASRIGTTGGTAAGAAPGTVFGTSAASGVGAVTGGAIGGGPNPNTAPNFGPTQQKNPEWITGQQEFEKRWQAAKSKLLPIQPGETGDEPEHILDRFKAAIGIIQEVSLGSTIGISTMAMRVRAGIEYLIPQIWSDNRILKRFFDPNFNVGYLNAESLARIVYLPENYRNLSNFTNDQKKNIRRIRRVLVYALHPDTAKVDADKSLQESADDLLKIFNPAWSYIENLIK